MATLIALATHDLLNSGHVESKLGGHVGDRSFVISIDAEKNGKVKISFEEQDSGHNVKTVADVAAFLHTDRASVRRMTGDRAQHWSHHPIPFVKVRGQDDSVLQTRC